MPKAVMFDCYNTLLRYESEEDRDGIWKMMKETIQYTTECKLQVTPKELETLYKAECVKEEKECICARSGGTDGEGEGRNTDGRIIQLRENTFGEEGKNQ